MLHMLLISVCTRRRELTEERSYQSRGCSDEEWVELRSEEEFDCKGTLVVDMPMLLDLLKKSSPFKYIKKVVHRLVRKVIHVVPHPSLQP